MYSVRQVYVFRKNLKALNLPIGEANFHGLWILFVTEFDNFGSATFAQWLVMINFILTQEFYCHAMSWNDKN